MGSLEEREGVAALPCRVGEAGLEVLLVTSRLDGSWGIPKGGVDGRTPPRAAAAEAYEEAGVRGEVAEVSVGTYRPRVGGPRVPILVLHVGRELQSYPERGKRQREWLSQTEAIARVASNPELGAVIASLTPAALPPLPGVAARPALWLRPREARPVVCLDLDDTILARSDEPLPGAVAAVEVLASRGCRLVASTARLDPVWAGTPRQAKIEAHLAACGFPIEELHVEVPSADLYVDDKGHPFDGDWESLADVLSADLLRAKRRPRVSFALAGTLMLASGEVHPEASVVLESFRSAGGEVIVSLGNFRPEGAGDADERTTLAQAWLQAAGISVDRVHPGKVSSDLYVDPHAFPCSGDWGEDLPRVLRRLGLGEGP